MGRAGTGDKARKGKNKGGQGQEGVRLRPVTPGRPVPIRLRRCNAAASLRSVRCVALHACARVWWWSGGWRKRACRRAACARCRLRACPFDSLDPNSSVARLAAAPALPCISHIWPDTARNEQNWPAQANKTVQSRRCEDCRRLAAVIPTNPLDKHQYTTALLISVPWPFNARVQLESAGARVQLESAGAVCARSKSSYAYFYLKNSSTC